MSKKKKTEKASQWLDRKISYFQSVRHQKPTEDITIGQALEYVAGTHFQDKIKALRISRKRNLKDYKKLKATSLPAFTFSATFTQRNESGASGYSGILCVDIDELPTNTDIYGSISGKEGEFREYDLLQAIRKKLKESKHVLAFFDSPSGAGLKVLIPLSTPQSEHKEAFITIESYFKENFDITIDEKCKDVSRLCFVSHDSDLYIASEIEPWNWHDHVGTKKPRGKTAPQEKKKEKEEKKGENDITTVFEGLRAFTDNKEIYQDGNRNRYVNTFLMNCVRAGIDDAAALTYCLNEFSDYVEDDGQKQVESIVKSVYQRFAGEFGDYKSYFFNESNGKRPERKRRREVVNKTFWYEITVVNKDGQSKRETRIDKTGLIEFIAEMDISILPLKKMSSDDTEKTPIQFVRNIDNRYQVLSLQRIKWLVFDWAEENCNKEVLKVLRTGVKTLFGKELMETLPRLEEIEFNRDTRESAYLYFQNKHLKITKSLTTL